MAVTWRHLVGSTDRFALEVSLSEDPDADRHAPAALSASWGEFAIFVEGRNLCEAKDPTGVSLSAARWYLHGLLDFFIRNWEPIVHQEKLPRPPRFGTSAATQMASTESPPPSLDEAAARRWDDDWWNDFASHCLASARDGGIFPNIWFRRSRGDVEVSWDNDTNPAEAPLRFLERQGASLIPVEQFASVLGEAARATLDQLLVRVTNNELRTLKRELDAIHAPDPNRQWLRWALLLSLRSSAGASVDLLRRLAQEAPVLRPPSHHGLFAPMTLDRGKRLRRSRPSQPSP